MIDIYDCPLVSLYFPAHTVLVGIRLLIYQAFERNTSLEIPLYHI